MELKDGDPSEAGKANMGIYGIGKRRSLAQLNDFVGIDLAAGTGNEQVSANASLLCSALENDPDIIAPVRI